MKFQRDCANGWISRQFLETDVNTPRTQSVTKYWIATPEAANNKLSR
jgi:hypothetical protein